MTTAPALSPLERLDWRKAGLATASVAINLALLAALSFTALGVDDGDRVVIPPPVYLDIEPRPLLPDERPLEPVPAVSTSPAQAARDAGPTEGAATAANPEADRPSPPRPHLSAPAPQGVPTPDDPWRVDPDDRRAGMARALRQGAVGCASPELLNELERRHCRDRFGERAAVAPPITGSGNPERDAAFARQGARRLAEWEMMNRPLAGGVGVVGPADCIGSNFGTGCAGAHLPDVSGVDMRQGGRTTHNGGERRPQGFSASIGGIRIGGDDD
jgi:hypothetical protein